MLLFNLCLGWLGLMVIFQNTLDDNIVNIFLDSVPSQFGMWIGFIYLFVMLIRKISDTWKAHRTNFYEVKKAKESYKQSKIITQKKSNELNKLDGI
jgi:hypothetical protein